MLSNLLWSEKAFMNKINISLNIHMKEYNPKRKQNNIK